MKRLTAGPAPHTPLAVIYALLTVYGLGSALAGVTTLDVVAGAAWGLTWPALVAVLALASFVGVVRSRITDKEGWEVVSTLLLIALLAGYAIAIPIRTMLDGDWSRLPFAVLPVVAAVFPASRLLDIARTGRKS